MALALTQEVKFIASIDVSSMHLYKKCLRLYGRVSDTQLWLAEWRLQVVTYSM